MNHFLASFTTIERESGLSAQLLQSGGAHVCDVNKSNSRPVAVVVVVVFRLRSWLDDDDVRCRSTTRPVLALNRAEKKKKNEKKRVEQTEHKWR